MRFAPASTWPLLSTAALAFLAAVVAWPEPLDNAYVLPSILLAIAGMMASVPFWPAARAEAEREGKSGALAAGGMAVAGAFTAGILLHLLNAAPPIGRNQTVVLAVTDTYTQRGSGRRSRTRHYVVTAPASGPVAIPTRHQVGGLFDASGSYRDYQPGGCMAFTWRPGLFWPVVRRRAAVPCPAGLAARAPQELPAATVPAMPFARPGPGWPQVDSQLAGIAGRLDLPPAGEIIMLEVTADGDGRIITLRRGNRLSDPVAARLEAAVAPALMGKAETLAGPPGQYRLTLRLMPPPR
jgi:hypothetical protein